METRVRVRKAERGASKVKTIFSLLVVLYVAYLVFQIVPPMIDKYNLEDTMRTEARFAVVNRKEADDIRESIWRKVKDLGIDRDADGGIRREDIKVDFMGRNVNIVLKYRIKLNLIFGDKDLDFEAAAGDRAL